jgi:hypothetical protein
VSEQRAEHGRTPWRWLGGRGTVAGGCSRFCDTQMLRSL